MQHNLSKLVLRDWFSKLKFTYNLKTTPIDEVDILDFNLDKNVLFNAE